MREKFALYCERESEFMNYIVPKKEQLNQLMEIDFLPMDRNYSLEGYEKISLDKLTSTGLSLASISPIIHEFKNLKLGGETLYKMVSPNLKGVLQSKGGITLGHFVNPKNSQIVGRAKFETVTKTAATVNPYALLITAAVATVTKKLDAIKENQLEIIEFIELQEGAKIKGNIKVLQEISDQFKYNMENEKYKSSKFLLAQDIKKDAEQSILFAKDLIISKASKSSFIHTDKTVKDKINKLEEGFNKYQLALYQFSYSSFLEVMLLENFDEQYLDSVYKKIITYIEDFRKLHNDCYKKLVSDSKTSIESAAVKGFVGITKFAGKTISKIPYVKNGQMDEKLIESSDKINDYNERRIINRMDKFLVLQENCSLVFAENIKTVNKLFNNEIEVLFDEENLYISI